MSINQSIIKQKFKKLNKAHKICAVKKFANRYIFYISNIFYIYLTHTYTRVHARACVSTYLK